MDTVIIPAKLAGSFAIAVFFCCCFFGVIYLGFCDASLVK